MHADGVRLVALWLPDAERARVIDALLRAPRGKDKDVAAAKIFVDAKFWRIDNPYTIRLLLESGAWSAVVPNIETWVNTSGTQSYMPINLPQLKSFVGIHPWISAVAIDGHKFTRMSSDISGGNLHVFVPPYPPTVTRAEVIAHNHFVLFLGGASVEHLTIAGSNVTVVLNTVEPFSSVKVLCAGVQTLTSSSKRLLECFPALERVEVVCGANEEVPHLLVGSLTAQNVDVVAVPWPIQSNKRTVAKRRE